MGTIRECDLPGIGRKYQIETSCGDQMVIIIHNDGRREIYHFEDGEQEECISQVTLEDEEARQIASIIGGMTYKPKALETIEVTLQQLIIDWFRVEPSFKCLNKTIAELEVRQRTGATILAIVGKKEQRINPGPNEPITADTTIVVAGEREQITRFKELLLNG
ncbi:potassium:proton antiporter [Paenibacillus nanensis]|uniref:Potassium:proton antiporter n=1 Tax=Paenibacillus nanensis TaxID=393251 RepID=A0A3A1URU6_9BACL|nr:cation:proton antiporter regulatory subunit [Paenibacillus nanensis]RIX50955.1 potassium:proton antiporter [Paenibacillus nanensis]